MNSYLFKITALSDNRLDFRSWERYVSASSRREAFAILAVQLVNSQIEVRKVEAIEPGTGLLAH